MFWTIEIMLQFTPLDCHWMRFPHESNRSDRQVEDVNRETKERRVNSFNFALYHRSYSIGLIDLDVMINALQLGQKNSHITCCATVN